MDTQQIAEKYFDTWAAGDFDGLRSVLADDVVFDGPMGHVEGGDAAATGLSRLDEMLDRIEVKRRWVDGDDVATWFELHAKGVEQPLPVVNWSHVRDGKISRIRVTFDPRPLLERG